MDGWTSPPSFSIGTLQTGFSPGLKDEFFGGVFSLLALTTKDAAQLTLSPPLSPFFLVCPLILFFFTEGILF